MLDWDQPISLETHSFTSTTGLRYNRDIINHRTGPWYNSHSFPCTKYGKQFGEIYLFNSDYEFQLHLESPNSLILSTHSYLDLRTKATLHLSECSSLTATEAHIVAYPMSVIGCPSASPSFPPCPCIDSRRISIILQPSSELRLGTKAHLALRESSSIKLAGLTQLMKAATLSLGREC